MWLDVVRIETNAVISHIPFQYKYNNSCCSISLKLSVYSKYVNKHIRQVFWTAFTDIEPVLN